MRGLNVRFASWPFMLVALAALLAQAPPSSPYSLTISARTGAAVGTAVTVQITLENISPGDVTFVKSRAELSYDVAVVTALGAPVMLTPYGRSLHGQPTTPPIMIRDSPHEVTLKPHQKIVDTIALNKIYQLAPGDYIVQVHKRQLNNAVPNVASNPLKLTIASN
ncbi:MAG: hypothetical protein JO356_10810 [Acidobacteria bacterium]|nr:hypothetical protein [Acidobacteriota bacterium]